MTSQALSPVNLSDHDLSLAELEHAVSRERHATAQLIALLMEVDSRKLYAGHGYSSLFTYCVQKLHFSEHAAYLRIQAARAARRFPAILDTLADGSLHLTAVSLIAPHLTHANHVELLTAVRHKSKREIEHVLARLRPQADLPTVVRKLPAPASPLMSDACPTSTVPPVAEPPILGVPPSPVIAAPAPVPAVIKPLAPERYKVQFTVGRDTHDKLRRVQDLMRHSNSTGDISAIFDRALTLLLADLSKSKCGAVERPPPISTPRTRSRHIPATVKREVWQRDGGRCAFRGVHGRCTETGFMEFHHVVPYADGGEMVASNLELRCRAHNQYEADLWSGAVRIPQVRESRAQWIYQSSKL